jgi:hypothetical protein
VLGESTHMGYLDAEAWLVKKHDPPESPQPASDGSTGPARRAEGPGEPRVS